MIPQLIGARIIVPLLGVFIINTMAIANDIIERIKHNDKEVYAYSTYWQNWDEVFGINESPVWGQEFVVREIGESNIRTHCTTHESEYFTTEKPPNTHMNPSQAKEWCKKTNKEALERLKEMGLSKNSRLIKVKKEPKAKRGH